MTAGRAATFVVILAVSLGLARELVRRKGARPARVTSAEPARLPAVSSRPSGARSTVLSMPSPLASALQPPRAAAEEAPLLDPLGEALCPEGMVLAEGTTCAWTSRICKTKSDPAQKGCAEYEPAHCRTGLPLRFCIDRDEYPNQEGMLPAAVVSFEEAESTCEDEGKRLCSEMEWQFACEGPSGAAFGYGDARSAAACNVGKPAPNVRPEELWESRDIALVVERVDARTRSGALPGCTSPFGARDMIGNVEEWVRSDTSGGARALRGGEYTSDPTCAAVRKLKVAGYRQFHTGFRCCRDPLVRLRGRPREGGHPGAGTVAPPPRFD